jgi:hypothetical protein
MKEQTYREELQRECEYKINSVQQDFEIGRIKFQNECNSERDSQIKMIIQRLYAEFSEQSKQQRSAYIAQVEELQNQLEKARNVIPPSPKHILEAKKLHSEVGVQACFEPESVHIPCFTISPAKASIETKDKFTQILTHTLDKSTLTTFPEELVPRQHLEQMLIELQKKQDQEIKQLHLKVSDLINKKNSEIVRLESSLQQSITLNSELEQLIQQLGAEV